MFHLFLCLLVISIFSLKEVYSNPLPIFKDSCKSVDLQEFFVCSRYKSLLKYMICNCFLHCGSHLFIFLMVLLETFTIFWLIFILHFCYLFSNDLCLSCFKCLSKKSSVPLGTRCVQKQKEQILVYMMSHSSSGEPKPWCLSEKGQDQAWPCIIILHEHSYIVFCGSL